MKIVIAGAGAVGTHLARLLSKDDFDVVLMDEDIDHLAKLNQEIDIMTLGISPDSIKGQMKAGVDNANLFIAATPHGRSGLIPFFNAMSQIIGIKV